MKLNAANMTEMENYANNKVLSNLYILDKLSETYNFSSSDTKECSIHHYYLCAFILQNNYIRGVERYYSYLIYNGA